MIFRAENALYFEIKWVGTEKDRVAKGIKCFITIGVFFVELLAYQISMVSDANWPR